MPKEEKELSTEEEAQEAQEFRAKIAEEVFDDSSIAITTPPTDPTTPVTIIENAKGDGEVAGEGGEIDEKKIKKEGEKGGSKEDLWAGVPTTLKDTFTTLSKKVDDLNGMSTRLKQTEHRIGAVQNFLHEKGKKNQGPVVSPQTEEEKAKEAVEKEQWKTLKEDFPVWAEAMEAKLERAKKDLEKSQGQNQGSMEEIQTTLQEQMKEGIDALSFAFEKKLLGIKHPQWETTKDSPQYKEWFATQPDAIKKLGTSSFAVDAIKVLDGYGEYVATITKTKKKSPAEIAEERQKELKVATSPSGSPTKVTKSDEDMSPAELRMKYAKEAWADG